MSRAATPLPITAIVVTKNEEKNIGRCLAALNFAERVIVVDSQSNDRTLEIAGQHHAEIVQFHHEGGYPKKKQWALDTLLIETPWVLVLDADEIVTPELRAEMASAIQCPSRAAYYVKKGFHFLGSRLRFGGFSHSAVSLFRVGRARFERLIDDYETGWDVEAHERMIVQGRTGRLRQPLIHEDFKNLAAYIDRHNKFSTWEAHLRHQYLSTGRYGEATIAGHLAGDVQERRRFLKKIVLRVPFEPQLWFLYHYIFRLGFLEGRRGLIASRLRAGYISHVKAKLYELRLREERRGLGGG